MSGTNSSAPLPAQVFETTGSRPSPACETTPVAEGDLRLHRAGDGLQATIADGDPIPVRLLRLRPISDPTAGFSVCDIKKNEVALVTRPDRLDPDSRRIAEEELGLRYDTPDITTIEAIRCSSGLRWVTVDTDRGPRSILLKNLEDQVRPIDGDGLLIRDQTGQRYRIPSLAALPPASRKRLREVL